MKRFLAAFVSLSLIIVSAPPSSWAQLHSAAAGSTASGAVSAAGAAARVQRGAIPALPSSALAVTSPVGGALLPAAAAGLSLAAPASAPRVSAAAAAPGPVKAEARSLSEARREVSEISGSIVNAPAEGARWAVTRMMDRLLGLEEAEVSQAGVVEALDAAGTPAAKLGSSSRVSGRSGMQAQPPSPSAPNAPRVSNVVGAIKALATMGLAAAVAFGLQAGAVALLPALFGVVPLAAVWAVSSGLLLFPLSIYARWRLSKRDSPRLDKIKIFLDIAIGAYAGAVAIAVPSLGVVLSASSLLISSVPLVAMVGGRWLGSTAFADSMMVWGALGLTQSAVAVVAATGLIGLSPLIGMMALPVMTTIAFFLGRLIHSAETGAPFSVPGGLQKVRFPAFQWVMLGVVFALLTGYPAVYVNWAFMSWNLLGGNKPTWNKDGSTVDKLKGLFLNFDTMYLATIAFVVATGLSNPLTFLLIAFSVERAAIWTERLLAKFLPESAAAPSTQAAPAADAEMLADKAPKWPAFHYWAKTFLLIGSMGAMAFMFATTVFGVSSLLTNLGIASVFAFIPFFFAKNIIKALMKAEPTTKERDPEFFSIMEGLRDKINAGRRAKGKQEIPMPEMVVDPMEAPNAYATGRSPFAAMVGVTKGIKAMTLDPENVRAGVVRLIAAADPDTKEFKVFRRAIEGSVTGMPAEATPSQVADAVLKADSAELKALGVRMLRGVLGHEFSHVMDRHMLSGSIGASITVAVNLASYGVMWAVGSAKAAIKKALGWGSKTAGPDGRSMLEPISTGAVISSLPFLIKLFAALWGPVVMQIMQMAASRNNEGMADEDGALLSEDPESLALALGLLTTWRPPSGFSASGALLARAAALQSMMTVNPLEQFDEAGALPRSAAAGAPSRADDIIFEQFITHPNTGVRIRKLHDMSEALKNLKSERPPPLAFVSPAGSAPALNGGGLLQGAWQRLVGLLRVLPDEDRNHQFWVFTLTQAVVMLGASFHYTAMPKLVAPTAEDGANRGYSRVVNGSAQALSSLVTGPIIDRSSTQRAIEWTLLGRSLVMMMVPVLFFHGFFGFGIFSALIAVAGFLQVAGSTASSVAFNRILENDEAHYNRANAVSTIVMNVVGVIGPALAGGFIVLLDAYFGLLAGNALSYGVYAVTLLASAVGTAFFLELPRDEIMSARRELDERLKRDGVGPVRYAGVTSGQVAGRKTLLVEIDGDPALASGLPSEYAGFPVKAIARRHVLTEIVEGFTIIVSDRFLRMYLLVSALAILSGDALLFVVMPRFIEEVLKAGPGAFGLFLSVAALGMGIGSGLMAFARDPEQMALAPAARVFRAELFAREPALDASALDAASAALRGAVPAVLARYKAEWREGGAPRSADVLAQDVLAEGAKAVGLALGRSQEVSAAILEVTGAARDVRSWAAGRGSEMLSRAFEEARGGMDHLQRQGSWTSWVHGLSWLAYASMFFTGSMYGSAALMLVSALFAGPEVVVWASLLTKVVAGFYPESQGKIYSALYLCQMLLGIAGLLLYGWVMTSMATLFALPAMAPFWITSVILAACALIDFKAPSLLFPIDRKPSR